jgi:hypothetical protein
MPHLVRFASTFYAEEYRFFGFWELVGIHLRLIPGQWPLVLNFTEEHQQLLRLLGEFDERFYSCIFATMRHRMRNVGFIIQRRIRAEGWGAQSIAEEKATYV